MIYDFKKLTPFKWFVLQNFPFIEEDFDAITNYQMFCKLGEEINKLINSQNNVGEQVENLTNAFNELQNYVNNYFENLDVQDEINNKLDEMVEDGTLEEIITEYLNIKGILAFDNINDMKSANNLINGSFVKTYGYHSVNDGGGAFYKIRTITNQDIADNMFIVPLEDETLIAELIFNDTINIKQLGAYGDNTNDDTLIIQSALDKETYAVYIPIGTYKITNTLLMKETKKLYGNNSTRSILNMTDSSKDILQLYNGDTYAIQIENLKFQHSEIGTGNGIVFGSSGVWQLNQINNCRFTNNNIAIYVPHTGGSLYSSMLSNIEIFNYNVAGIELLNIGSSGNIYDNIYMHNNNRSSTYGMHILSEDNFSMRNINIEWGNYTTAPLYLQQCNGEIDNIHFEGVESNVAFQFLNRVQVKILNAWLNFVNSTFSIFNIENILIKINIDILKIINNTGSNQTVRTFLYTEGQHVVNDNEVKVNNMIYSDNNIIENNSKLFGSHRIPEIYNNIVYSEKIHNKWKLYLTGTSNTVTSNEKGNQIEFINGIKIDNVTHYKAVCKATGVSTDELITDSASFTQYSSSLIYPKTAGIIEAGTSIKFDSNTYITSSNSYSYDTNNYAVNLDRASATATGTYSLYKTQAQYDYV